MTSARAEGSAVDDVPAFCAPRLVNLTAEERGILAFIVASVAAHGYTVQVPPPAVRPGLHGLAVDTLLATRERLIAGMSEQLRLVVSLDDAIARFVK